MNTWKTNLEETKRRYVDWWNQRGIIINMWEHFQEGVTPHADIPAPPPPKDLNQKWFDAKWRADYLDWYVAHSCLKADMLPVANTQLGPGSLAAILGGVFEGGEDTIWIHPNPDFSGKTAEHGTTDGFAVGDITFDPHHPNWLLHKDLLKACKQKAQGHYYVGMPDLMEGLDVLAALEGTDRVLMDTVMQPEVVERQVQQINDIYFRVFDELYDIIREGDEMAFCYFSSWAPGKMSKLQSDISTMISEDDYRRFVQPFIREQCQRIPYTLYHLDGVGAMRHLPALLEIDELNAIQWTPGVGQPQGGSTKWYDLYRRILAAGKSVMACWVTLPELRPLLDAIGTNGVHIEMDFHNEQEVEEALRIVESITSRPSLASRPSLPPNSLIPGLSPRERGVDSSAGDELTDEEVEKEVEKIISKVEEIVLKIDNSQSSIPNSQSSIPNSQSSIPHSQSSILNSQSSILNSQSSNSLYEAIVAGKSDAAVAATREAVVAGADPQSLINQQMITAMGEVGQRFQDGKAFVPQLLMAGRAMKAALDILKPMLAGTVSTSIGKVVIGTVKGDLHDIGKNLVASMLEGCGFEVVNVGIDVSADTFIQAVKENQPDILCMSALLTTTMPYMKEVIDALEQAGIRQQVKVMVGGAPVTQGFADEIGADGYSDNANSAVTVAKQLLRERNSTTSS